MSGKDRTFRLKITLLLGVFIIIGISLYLQRSNVLAQTAGVHWQTPVNLSQSGGNADPVLAVDANGLFHLIWNELNYNTGYNRSEDQGSSWQTPQSTVFPFSNSKTWLVPDSQGSVVSFWLADRNQFFTSRITGSNFGSIYSWTNPQLLAETALTIDAVASESNMYLVYIRNFSSSDFPAGIYFRRSVDNGASWSLSTLIYDSLYFRNMLPAEARVQVVAGATPGEIHILWDHPYLKKIMSVSSYDGGFSWGEIQDVVSPDASTALAAANQINLTVNNSNYVRTWQVGSLQTGCQQYFQTSSDFGITWSDAQVYAPEITSCSNITESFLIEDGSILNLLVGRDNAYLIAWNGSSWSTPQPQPELINFNNPDTFDLVELGCQQGFYQDHTFHIFGCDTGTVKDIWYLRTDINDIQAWYPGETSWSPPTTSATSDQAIHTPIIASDQENRIYSFWSQAIIGENAANSPANSLVYYSIWDGDRWTEPLTFLRPLVAGADQPNLLITELDRFNLVWRSLPEGNILYAWANSNNLINPSDWADAVSIPALSLPASSPMLAAGPQGELMVVYALPVNEKRGVYLVTSLDRGATWSEPILVFDGAAEGWEVVDSPQLTVTNDGSLHVQFQKYTLAGGLHSAGIYYTRSSDGGQTWSPIQAILESPVEWSQLTGLGAFSLHRAWQVRENDTLTLFQEFSYDGGQTWQSPSDLTAIDLFAGPVTFVIAPDGMLHFLQIAGPDLDSMELRHDIWQENRWDSQPGTPLENVPQLTPGTLSGFITASGQLSTIHLEDLFDPDTSSFLNALVNLNTQVSMNENPPQNIVTPPPTVPATEIPTTPVISEPTPTPTIDFALIPPPSSGASSSTFGGLILGGIISLLVIGGGIGIFMYRNR